MPGCGAADSARRARAGGRDRAGRCGRVRLANGARRAGAARHGVARRDRAADPAPGRRRGAADYSRPRLFSLYDAVRPGARRPDRGAGGERSCRGARLRAGGDLDRSGRDPGRCGGRQARRPRRPARRRRTRLALPDRRRAGRRRDRGRGRVPRGIRRCHQAVPASGRARRAVHRRDREFLPARARLLRRRPAGGRAARRTGRNRPRRIAGAAAVLSFRRNDRALHARDRENTAADGGRHRAHGRRRPDRPASGRMRRRWGC